MKIYTDQLKIAVVGSGYVGLSLAVLLAKKNNVTLYDIDKDRVDLIKSGIPPINDPDIKKAFLEKQLKLKATSDKNSAYKDADFVIVATPTNYNSETNKFDTTSVDSVVSEIISKNPKCIIVIKSTIPVGHTKALQKKYKTNRIIFSPEFLREGTALKDNLNPSRIIIGSNCENSKIFANLLESAADANDIDILFVNSTEAESIKLFSNAYLAMRVSFFNELDSYALSNNLNTKSIIDGVCLDHRIGKGYNNPSFGYGGYCLPKDTKQLLANFDQVPQTLMKAVVSSNSTRKDFIANEILKSNAKTVGFYRLVMKEGSDNFRSSAVKGIIKRIKSTGSKVVIYEPKLNEKSFYGSLVISDLNKFKEVSDIIVANRMSGCLEDVIQKCFSRDLFREN